MKGIRKLNMLFAVVLCLVMFFALAACNKETEQKLVSDVGITVEGGGFEKGSALVTESIETTGEKGREIVTLLEEQNYNKELQVSIYDIFVAKDGNEVQPDGKVKITIPAPFESENGYVTFHVKDDDSVETLVTTYAEGKISFETDSFSYFVVAAANNPSEAKKYTFTATIEGSGEGNIHYLVFSHGDKYQNTVREGTEITLRAEANGGFKFIGWYLVSGIFDEFISADEEYTFTVNSDMTVYARIEKTFTFSVDVYSGHGSFVVDGENAGISFINDNCVSGDKIKIKAIGDENHEFEGWYTSEATPVLISTDAEYTFTIDGDAQVLARFKEKVKSLSLDGANAGFENGQAVYSIGEENQPSPADVIVYGVTLSDRSELTKDVDYTIDLGGLDFEKVGTYTITYTYVKDTTVKATLTVVVEGPNYLLKVGQQGAGGTVSINGGQASSLESSAFSEKFKAKTRITLVAATRTSDYIFLGWYEVDDTVLTHLVLKDTPVSTDATYAFDMPEKAYTVYAVFEAKVTGLILDGANAGFTEGKATYTIGEATRPVPENVVVSGATVLGSVPFTKDVDYTIDLGGLDFERVGTYTITYTYVKDTTIKETLTIEVVEPKYLFGAYIASGMGSISYNGVEQPNGYQAELTAGTKVTLTATPSDGYNFVGWFEPETTDATALVLKETPVSTSATYEFTVPAKEYRVYAVFEEVITYTFSAYITGEGGYFEINGTDGGRDYWAEKLNTGDRITLKVVANRGYEFKGWYAATDVPSFISASAEYTFTVENADISVEAVFEAKVTGLILDGANAGFTEGKATYTMGEENKPTPENVVVSGATVLGSVPFTKDVDYTIDLGGLDFERVGTYTITYTYVKDTTIKETLTIEVVAPKFTFSAVTENANGSIYYNDVVQPNGYCAELEANSSVTLKAVAKTDYEFVGWYTATDVPEFISESAEYTFVTGNADKYVMARFAAKILYLWSDSSNAGFNDNAKSATVTIGDAVLPDPQAVLIYAGTAEGDVLLTKNVDYTIELGGLDFSQEGTYTITYRHTKNTSLTTQLTVYVVAAQAPVTINLSYSGTADPVKYNGGRAAYVFKSSILNNGEACDIESLGLFYEWRDHTTKAVVAVAKDDTWDSTSAHYPSPAVPGTYDFVVYKLENEVKTDLLTVTRTIVENQFAVVTDLSSLSEYVCYTFIAKAGDNYYAMSNPFSGNTEREAILVTPDSNGVISLGNNYEYVFRPYDTGKTSSGLVCYGCRTGNGLNRTGNLVLWGTGGIEYNTSTSADYTVTFVLNADGTITVHAPFCEGTLRLVYDATSGKFMFTAKKAVDDTRTSYPVYLYGEYTEPVVEPKETYEFFGKLSKEYDGNAVSFNVYKEVNVCTENGEDVAAVLKNGTGRFVWTDAQGNVISVATPDESGNVTGPSAIGSYRLVFQTQQKGENGMEWVEKAVLHSFEITAPAEVN
ncbi:MAG: InlB B-repeat-containing protein [Christensenellales bacterium]